MPKTRKQEILRFRVNDDLYNAVKGVAAQKGVTLADVCRELLEDAIARQQGEQSQDYLLALVKRAVKEELKPVEERLAKISAKNAITSGTSMFMNMQVIQDRGYDAQDVYTKARKKAVALLKQSEDDE
ncbi:hypothetical protein J8366_22810 [Escherichia coli]|uniref:hypothetical protein n=1 Tax=Brevibacillus agri TaxID=51101 RepID=UPI001755AD97|nr:hypothetical protein [Brevibacillus agri]MBP2799568.1 hypothetical protein [Escherichia coli]MDR9507589.1 hypothetical protein [Brevibacillus agri]HAJ4019572.1 hypothetical protein [Escherichia coli]